MDMEALTGVQNTLPSLESAFEQQKTLLHSAEQETLKARKELQETAPGIKQARAMDQSLVDLNRNIAQKEEKNTEATRELDELDLPAGGAGKAASTVKGGCQGSRRPTLRSMPGTKSWWAVWRG